MTKIKVVRILDGKLAGFFRNGHKNFSSFVHKISNF